MKPKKPRSVLRKFDGGQRTVTEYFAEFGFPPDAQCVGCGRKPCIRAIVMVPFDEANRRGMLPPGATLNPAILQTVVMLRNASGGQDPHVRLSVTYSCTTCQKAFETALAKAPSWAVVEINRGPDPTNRVTVGLG